MLNLALSVYIYKNLYRDTQNCIDNNQVPFVGNQCTLIQVFQHIWGYKPDALMVFSRVSTAFDQTQCLVKCWIIDNTRVKLAPPRTHLSILTAHILSHPKKHFVAAIV